ncbi:WD40-repeat-containing domain protein [Scleroderma yunnanense]
MDSLDPHTAPAYSIKEGHGWMAVFNPDAHRQMDVQLHKCHVHDRVVCSVKFSADGRFLAVGTNNAVILYDISRDQKVTFPLGTEESDTANHARSVAISPDNKFLVAGSEDRVVRIWNTETYAYVNSLVGHRGEVYALAFTQDSRYLLSASGDCTIRIWDATQFQLETTVELSCRILRSVGPDEKPSSKMVFISLSVDSLSSFAAAGSLDGIIRVWDIRPGSEREQPVGVLVGHADGVYGVQFLPSYTADEAIILVSASLDRTLKRWEIMVDEKQFLCKKTLTGHKDCILATSVLQIGREQRVASASRDGTVRLWDLKTGMPYFMIQGHTNTVTSVDLCSDGSLMASGSGDREVRVWKYTLQ